MRVLSILIFTFFINHLVHADNFELTVFFNLNVAEKHEIVSCRQGGEQLDTEYHLTVFKDKPQYTILGNLDLDHNVAVDVEKRLHCNQGNFTLRKLIKTEDDFVNLFIYLEEIYFIKDEIFEVANVKLSSDENYFIQEKFINALGQVDVKTSNSEQPANFKSEAARTDDSDLLYRIEIKRI